MLARNGDGKWRVDPGGLLQLVIIVATILISYFSTMGEIKTSIAVHENRLNVHERRISNLEDKWDEHRATTP